MSKMNIDMSLDDLMAKNTDRFQGLRKTRDGKVLLNRRYRFLGNIQGTFGKIGRYFEVF